MQSSTDTPRAERPADRVNRALRHVPPVTIYLAGAGWALWLFWLGATGGLGPEPINALERAYGEAALQLLVAGLAVTPARRFLRINLMRFRRAIGVTCFFFALSHMLVWALLDLHSLPAIWADIVRRPYVTVGMVAFLLLLPLAVTSNDTALRRMGAAGWRRLHRLVYPAAIFAALHYLWIAKGLDLEPILYTALIATLLTLRLPPPRRLSGS